MPYFLPPRSLPSLFCVLDLPPRSLPSPYLPPPSRRPACRCRTSRRQTRRHLTSLPPPGLPSPYLSPPSLPLPYAISRRPTLRRQNLPHSPAPRRRAEPTAAQPSSPNLPPPSPSPALHRRTCRRPALAAGNLPPSSPTCPTVHLHLSTRSYRRHTPALISRGSVRAPPGSLRRAWCSLNRFISLGRSSRFLCCALAHRHSVLRILIFNTNKPSTGPKVKIIKR